MPSKKGSKASDEATDKDDIVWIKDRDETRDADFLKQIKNIPNVG